MFRKADYIPFALGVFIAGGLLFVPLLWSQFNRVDYDEAILPSLISCLIFFVAHDTRGNFSFHRFLVGFAFAFAIARTSRYSNNGQPMFIAGGFLGYLVMLACGWGGILIGRFIRGKEKIEQELLADQKIVEKETKALEPPDIDPAIIGKQTTPFHTFMAATYVHWRQGKMDSLSDIFKKEATQNTFDKFWAGHEKYKQDIDLAYSLRPFNQNEYLASLTKDVFIMTSKALYFLVAPYKVFLLSDIASYKLEGILSVSATIVLKSGETLVFPKMKAAPATHFIEAFRDGKIT